MEREEGNDGKLEEVENGMGGQQGLWKGHCWGHLSSPALSQGRLHPQGAAVGPCQGHSHRVGTAPMAQHRPVGAVPAVPPHPGSPPRPRAMGRDQVLCGSACGTVPVTPGMSSGAPKPCSPGSPWLWWPNPKSPTGPGCGDRQVGDTQEQEDV